MIDIKLIRTDPDKVRENIKKKFQQDKLPLVDEVIELDAAYRAARTRCDELRNRRNVISKQIGGMMARGGARRRRGRQGGGQGHGRRDGGALRTGDFVRGGDP